MSIKAEVAAAYNTSGSALADVSVAFEELTGVPPRVKRLHDLAGPNSTLQLLVDGVGWAIVFKAMIAAFGASFAGAAGKEAWKELSPLIRSCTNAGWTRLVNGVKEAVERGNSVILGLPERPPGRPDRHIGYEIQSTEPEEIARVINAFAENGSKIEQFFRELESGDREVQVAFQENSDCSAKVVIDDEGTIRFEVVYFSGKDGRRWTQKYEFRSEAS